MNREGHIIDFPPTSNRDRDVAETSLDKVIRPQGLLGKIIIDQSGANTKVIEDYNREYDTAILIRNSKHLNNYSLRHNQRAFRTMKRQSTTLL